VSLICYADSISTWQCEPHQNLAARWDSFAMQTAFKLDSLSLTKIWQQGETHLLCRQHFDLTVWASSKFGSKVRLICYADNISNWQSEPHQNLVARWDSFAMQTAFQLDSLSLTKIWQQGETHLLCRQHLKLTVFTHWSHCTRAGHACPVLSYTT
jgi:3-methyladenine DNA glycosylase AlkD